MPIYNNTPSAGGEYADFIKDATALPEDVQKGKIFYDNSGRQIGTGQIVALPQNVKSQLLPTGSGDTTRWGKYCTTIIINNGFLRSAANLLNDYAGQVDTTKALTASKIYGYAYNGVFYPLQITGTNEDLFFYIEVNNSDLFYIQCDANLGKQDVSVASKPGVTLYYT